MVDEVRDPDALDRSPDWMACVTVPVLDHHDAAIAANSKSVLIQCDPQDRSDDGKYHLFLPGASIPHARSPIATD